MHHAAEYIIKNCIEDSRKKLLIIYDVSTELFIDNFVKAAMNMGKIPELAEIESGKKHGEEPSETVLNKMLQAEAIMCLTKYSLAHTDARRQSEKKGIPFLSMPGYDESILSNKALMADYNRTVQSVNTYTELLSQGKSITIETESGTKLCLDITGRAGNCCPGITDSKHLLGSPPDIEANISPVEDFTHGKIVVDGSITDWRIGLLRKPVILYIEKGSIVKIESEDENLKGLVEKIFDDAGTENAYVVGEFGIGFNDCAKLCGNMLIDEGAKGCIHFGMGSNWTIGGINKVDFHLDFVVKGATVKIDGIKVIEKGVLLYG